MTRGPVLILGAGSTIARHIGLELAQKGHVVVLAGRDTEDLAASASDVTIRTGRACLVQFFDATLEGAGRLAMEATERETGPLEGVVMAVGYLGSQEEAEHDPDEAAKVMESNYTAPARALLDVATVLESRGGGWICALSSVAGDRGRHSNYLYGSAKAGLTTFLQGLRARLVHSGVAVITVKPGPVDTSMTFGMGKLPLLAQPEEVASRIVEAIQRRRDVVYVPAPWRWVMAVFRLVPERLFKRLKL
ncbi:MAG: SDR family oxidoreductase [Fimbriimonadaceae bacterium]|nr:SDR family oxidoreductase [Fimbriimonadaceae bacterium]